MPGFPVLLKTWQRPIQVSLPTQSTATIQAGLAAVAAKNAYVDPVKSQWRLKGCSDSVSANMSSVDLLNDNTDIVAATSGAHSWFVLRNQVTGQEFCVDFNQSNNQSVLTAMSVAAGFAGGSITARPTATDEVTLAAANIWFVGSNVGRFRLICLHSTDGKLTYAFILYQGIIVSAWCFGEALAHHTAWSPSLIGFLQGAGALSSTGINNSTRFDSSDNIMAYAASGTMLLRWTRAYLRGNLLEVLQTARPSRTEKWQCWPIGLACLNSPRRGKHGRMIDMFRVPNSIPAGWIFPSSDHATALMSLGIGWAIPWAADEPPHVF